MVRVGAGWLDGALDVWGRSPLASLPPEGVELCIQTSTQLRWWSLWLLAVALHAANDQRSILRVDRDALAEIQGNWGVSTDQLAIATEKVATKVGEGA